MSEVLAAGAAGDPLRLSFVENRAVAFAGGPAAIFNRGFLRVRNTTFAGNIQSASEAQTLFPMLVD
jgi:hypothetical protein